MLEWRPTLAADDRVRTAWHGRLGGRRLYDDDGDGRVDEDILNGKDDDGDGEIDEDLGFSCQEMMAADCVDDRRRRSITSTTPARTIGRWAFRSIRPTLVGPRLRQQLPASSSPSPTTARPC